MTADLLALADWLGELGVSHVAMESTGVFWKPVFSLLEGRFRVIMVNAEHVKKVPGRKTDVKDCEWLAELLQHGLLRASFVPPPAIRDGTRIVSGSSDQTVNVWQTNRDTAGRTIKAGALPLPSVPMASAWRRQNPALFGMKPRKR
jgi:hypothetical protein